MKLSLICCFILVFGLLLTGCSKQEDSTTPITPPTSPTSTTSTTGNEPIVTTYAGTGAKGFVDGTLKTAQFDKPYGIAVDGQGNVYVTEYAGSRIRKIAADGTVSTLAGSGVYGYKDGKGAAAQFRSPGKMVCDSQGNVYVIDDGSRIRKITPAGDVTSVAGNGSCGSADGPVASASFCGLGGIAISSTGDLYICDSNNNRIRKISGGQVTTVAGSKEGYADGAGSVALFKSPNAIAIDSKDNLYVGQTNLLRKITPQGVVSTFVGSSTGFSGPVQGTGAAVILGSPFGLATDASDNIYVADFTYSLIWKITPAGVATIITGGGDGYKEGGRSAQFYSPSDIGRDILGNFYVTDYNNYVIRKIVIK